MSAPIDRLAELRKSTQVNGIDFVEVDVSQTKITVHFVNTVGLSTPIPNVRITGGDVIPEVRVTAAAWSSPPGNPSTLELQLAAPGDFSRYTLSIDDLNLDWFYSRASFSFKVNCPSTLDCKVPPTYCPPEDDPGVAIDYLAKDFASFKHALLDFSARRYPRWVERSEADLGMVLLEAMAAVADDLSYTQDRVAAEAYLDTCTERQSLVHHARLVDYEPRPATVARVWLQFTVRRTAANKVPAGQPVFARAPDGEAITFETGVGLFDTTSYPVDPRWNKAGDALPPHIWDKSEACLASGATEMWLVGSSQSLGLDLDLRLGIWLLLETDSGIPGEAPSREMVRLTAVQGGTHDFLLKTANTDVTRIAWGREHALKRHHDLTRTTVSGNLVPGTQGRRRSEFFATVIEQPLPSGARPVVVRTGANGSDQFLFTLGDAPLAWLAPEADPSGEPTPEIRVLKSPKTEEYRWKRTLLSADEFDDAFTVDPARYRMVGAEVPGARRFYDYDGDRGDTIRFGDGTFGALPEDGALFEVTYRVGSGAAGNTAADAITGIDPGSPLAALATAVTNPFPARGGADQETAEMVRRDAPERFKENLRAVRREDYERVAAGLDWVQRAGTQFRYTGSWRTIFTAADALDTWSETTAGVPSPVQRRELIDLLNRRRLAGYESYVLAPRFVSLDLQVEVCARPDAFRGHVEDGLIKALGSARLPDGTKGFFHVDRFTFGMPLYRSELEAAIMSVPGVDGVRSITYRQRGRQEKSLPEWDTIPVGPDEILRVDSNPNRAERGSVRITVEGGK